MYTHIHNTYKYTHIYIIYIYIRKYGFHIGKYVEHTYTYENQAYVAYTPHVSFILIRKYDFPFKNSFLQTINNVKLTNPHTSHFI